MRKAFLAISIMLVAIYSLLMFSCAKVECPPTVTSKLSIDSSVFKKVNIPSYRITNAQVQSNPTYSDSTSLSVLALTYSISVYFDTIIYTYSISRAYFKIDYSDVPAGVTIGKAELVLFYDSAAQSLKWGANQGFTDSVRSGSMILKKVTSSWDATSLVWENQPTADPSSVLNISYKKPNPTCSINFTKIAQFQYSHPESNYGFVVELGAEMPTRGQAFYSAQAPAAVRPQLIIEYY